MRLVMTAAPEGRGDDIARTAFSVGIEKVSRRQVESQQADGKVERKDVVGIETSTPLRKRYVDALLASEFYNREDFTISIRQPRDYFQNRLSRINQPLGSTG